MVDFRDARVEGGLRKLITSLSFPHLQPKSFSRLDQALKGPPSSLLERRRWSAREQRAAPTATQTTAPPHPPHLAPTSRRPSPLRRPPVRVQAFQTTQHGSKREREGVPVRFMQLLTPRNKTPPNPPEATRSSLLDLLCRMSLPSLSETKTPKTTTLRSALPLHTAPLAHQPPTSHGPRSAAVPHRSLPKTCPLLWLQLNDGSCEDTSRYL